MMETTFHGLEQLIFRFSTILLYPTLALLVWYTLRVLWSLGEDMRDGWSSLWPARARAAEQRLRALRPTSPRAAVGLLRSVGEDRDQHLQVRRFAADLRAEIEGRSAALLPARARHLLARHEAELARDVDRVRVLVRIGPCLGLAGTLIPLGPGLAALGDGNLERLSSQLIVAFSTTVVGLAIGGVGYVLSVGRAHRADRAGADIELLYDILTGATVADDAQAVAPETNRQPVQETGQ